jgi:hypothetical protein
MKPSLLLSLPPFAAIMLLNGRVIEGASEPTIIQFVDPEMVTAHRPALTEKKAKAHRLSNRLPRSPRAKDISSSLQSASPTISFDTNIPLEYTFLVSGLPPTVAALQLLSLFAPYGHIFEISIQSTPSFDGSQLLCTGNAILRLYGSSQYRDLALGCLNGAFPFPYHTPIMVSLYQERSMT